MKASRSLFGAAVLSAAFTFTAHAVPPPTGVAPVTVPAGGFSIDGEVVAGSAGVNAGDWMAGPGGAGVLDASGVPLNPSTTFHFVDPFDSSSDNTFQGSSSWQDDPNSWQWTTSKANAKTDINNMLMHVATDTNLHTWLILAADRGSSSGSSYIDFEMLQNTLIANADGTFSSSGPNGGRTTNDLLLTLSFENGGTVADFLAYRWMTNSSSGGFSYVDATASLPAGGVFVALNSNTVAVPFGAFGQTNYSPMAFVEAAIDMTAMMSEFDPCFSIGVKTIMVKTKNSASSSSPISDFITPIQYSVRLGPGSDAGPNQTQCTQGASTAFALQGKATPGLFPVASTTWSVVSGSATIDSPSSLNTTAHVSSPSAALRLTVVQGNGCSETSDIMLTVAQYPSATISGPVSVLPLGSTQFSAAAGMSSYSWKISGDGSISGPTNAQTVTVVAGDTCGSTYTLSLNVFNGNCSSSTSTNILISDTGLPIVTPPASVTLECPANTSTSATGVATAHDNSGSLPVGYSDSINSTCGGTKVITRTWSTTNVCGYIVRAVQTITVQDTTPPSITPPADLVLECPANTSPTNTGTATALDGCSAVAVTFSDVVSNTCGGTKVISRLWTATDACGNIADAIQTITIVDTTPPSITAPADLALQCPADTTPANTGTATARDGCSTVTITYRDVVSNSCGGTKLISRLWTATDGCGNSVDALQLITVLDTTPPTITAPSNLALPFTSNLSTNSTGVATAQGGCSSVTVVYSDAVTPQPDGSQVIARTWTAVDACGRATSAVQTITLSMPLALVLPAQSDIVTTGLTSLTVTNTATDPNGPNDTLIYQLLNSPASATIDNNGVFTWTPTLAQIPSSSVITTVVTTTLTNSSGPTTISTTISTTNSFVVMIVDAPVIVAPPANLVLECPADTSPGNTGMAIASGGCSVPTVTYSDVISNTCGGANVISRLWSAADACGNSATALQLITVRDTTPPTITAPANLTLSFTADTSTNSTGVASAQDGCSSVTLGYSDVVTAQADGSQILTRTWVATDACGNAANVVQTISVSAPLPLILPVQSDMTSTDLVTLTVTNTATDPNGTNDILTYQLINPPAGATIDTNGVITWTPTIDQSPSTNVITTVVTTTVTNATGLATISTTNSFVVTVSGPYDGLDMLVDSDGDGLTNLVEVAVGSDPLNPADGNMDIIIYITQDSGNHYLAMQYKARINAAALQLQYLPEVSADKVAWFSDTNNVLQLSVTPADSVFNWVTVRDTTPITPAEARFIRLHVIWGAQESFSPIWIGSDTLLAGNNLTLFSQRMVRPILTAGTVSSINSTVVSDTNANFTTGQFGTNTLPSYVEFDNGAMMDIDNTSPQSIALASSAAGVASSGDAYRIRAHFTVASLFGTNNESGLVAGANPAEADNVLLFDATTQTTLTLFYFSNPSFTSWQGWVRADSFTPDPDHVVNPQEGVMVRRIVPSDAHVYLCGPIKLGVTLAPVQPGYNILGTLKSLSSLTLSNLNLYTGDSATGMVGDMNPSLADNLIVVQPDGSVTTYFYYYNPSVYQGWIDANGFTMANDALIPAGSAFFINRQAVGGFSWTIPAEITGQ